MMVEGTLNCIKCGKPSTIHSGHVIGKKRMAFGNLIDVKILAGWCSLDCHDSSENDINGCFGEYDNIKHGSVKNVFSNRRNN